MAIVTLTSDLGTQDFYLASIKGSLLSVSNSVNIVDITHQIPDYDIFKAADILKHSFEFFPKNTIHCILVNTQSHQKTPILIAQYKGQFFIGPDNGLFSLLFTDAPEKLVRITPNSGLQASSFPFTTFYLKAIEGLINEKPLEEIGETTTISVEKGVLMPYHNEDVIHGYVWHIDKFGNCFTNVSKALFDEIGKGQKFEIDIKNNKQQNIQTHYDSKQGGLMLVFFNYLGLLEVAISQGNASQLLGLNRSDKIIIRFGNTI